MANNNQINAGYTSTAAFTPVLSFGGASTGITYGTQTGSYSQIGKLVFFRATLILTNKGSATGNMSIAGLPLAPVVNGASGLRVSNVTFAAGYLQARVLTGSTFVVENITTGSAPTTIQDTAFANTSEIDLSGWYITA